MSFVILLLSPEAAAWSLFHVVPLMAARLSCRVGGVPRAPVVFSFLFSRDGNRVPLQNVAIGLTCEFTELLTRRGGTR
jgi:hypothetical protein